MKINKDSRSISYLATIAWLVRKGLRSRKLHTAKVILITTIAVIEFNLLVLFTSGIIRFLLVLTTFALSILAISESILNAILQKAYRISILMAFGAKRGLIGLLLLTESAIGSLVGSLIGSVVGLVVLFSFPLFAIDHAIHPLSMVLPLSLGIIGGVMACVHPILKELETSISERD